MCSYDRRPYWDYVSRGSVLNDEPLLHLLLLLLLLHHLAQRTGALFLNLTLWSGYSKTNKLNILHAKWLQQRAKPEFFTFDQETRTLRGQEMIPRNYMKITRIVFVMFPITWKKYGCQIYSYITEFLDTFPLCSKTTQTLWSREVTCFLHLVLVWLSTDCCTCSCALFAQCQF